jgi:hypothetical protein
MTHADTSRPGASPGELVAAGIERTLALAATWTAWDGKPRLADDATRTYTPNKALRRHADHLIDHLAEVNALLAGVPTVPDHWHASAVDLASDLAGFADADLNEARERLRRIGQLYVLRYAAAGSAEWDKPRDPNWTLREIAEHVGDPWYAEQVGDLSAPPQPD